MELAVNAAKFTPSGGTIAVRTSGPDSTKHILVEISETKPVEFATLHEAIARLSSNLPKAAEEL